MALKNMKNVDFKQFFLQKGEKIGLWICVGLMALLIVLTVTSLIGGPSAGANADKLTSLSKTKKQAIDGARPGPDLGNMDPKIQEASSPTQVPQGLFAFEPGRSYFDPGATEDKKWRLPTVLAADDFRSIFLHANVPSLIVSKQGDDVKLAVKVGNDTARTSQENKEEMKKNQKKSRRAKQYEQLLQQFQSMRGMGAMGGMGGTGAPRAGGMGPAGGGGMGPMMGGGGPGGMGAMGGGMNPMMRMMQGMGGMGAMADRMQAFGQGTSAMTGNQNLKIVFKSEDQVGNDELAEEVRPYRMVMITAAFPYRQELEQFRSALRFKSVDAMLNDQSVHGGAEFAGLSVQRREARPGEPIEKKEWADLPVEAAMKAVMILAADSDKSEQDQKLESFGIIPQPNRTVMKRPKLDDKLHKDNDKFTKYPEELPESVEKSLKEMEAANKGEAPNKLQKKKSRFDASTDYNAYGDDESNTEDPNKPPMNQPGNKIVNEQQETLRPEKILVRFYDVTVQPGMVYQYRVAVRMANPCYKSDKAVSKNITQEKEIRGAWAELPESIRIPDELLFYAVDEKRTESSYAFNDRMPVQVHHWLERVQTDSNNRDASFFAGDWSILERDWAHRGEYIGGTKEVEVPIWWPTLSKYLFAVNAEDIGKKRAPGVRFTRSKGVPVDFNTQALLVDFEGGKRNYTVGANKVQDEGPIEALVLTRDGKLLVHNSKTDTDNTERIERHKEWKETQQKVKDDAENKSGPSGDRFQNLIGPGKKQ